MNNREIFGQIHIGDYVAIECTGESILGFGRLTIKSFRGYVVMSDVFDIYLHEKDPIENKHRRFQAKIPYEEIISLNVLKKVDSKLERTI